MNVLNEINRLKKIVYYLQRKVIDGVGNLLSALSDVSIDTPLDGQVLTYDSATDKWVNAEPTGGSGSGGGGTVTSVSTSSPLTGGPITTSGTIGITQATTSTDGYLSSSDWNTFNSKQSALGYTAANDADVVKLTGDQTIAGVKNFSSFPVTPSSAPSTDYQVANKKYVDDNNALTSDEIETAFVLGSFNYTQR